MSVTIGSCRIANSNSKHIFEFTHSTADVKQLLNFLEIIDNNNIVQYIKEFILINRFFYNQEAVNNILKKTLQYLKNAEVVIIEISSIKDVIYNSVHLQLDLYQSLIYNHPKHIKRFEILNKNEIIRDAKLRCKTRDELIEDIQFITNHKLLANKKLIFVPHVNTRKIPNNDKKPSAYHSQNIYIPNRQLICNILDDFVKEHRHITYFNPMEYLPDDPNFIFVCKKGWPDYGHYTQEADKIVKDKLKEIINEKLNFNN
tara:strand:- start:250 stop:1023 length:774 start_codon:yes stop_codon:yes gene_type:complete